MTSGSSTSPTTDASNHASGSPKPIVTGVAIQYAGKTYTLPRPYRHHHVIRMIADENGVGINGPDVQGFVTNDERFVDRRAALKIALAAGQVLDPAAIRGGMLFSEDVW